MKVAEHQQTGAASDSVVEILEELIESAWMKGASDIHSDPGHTHVTFRIRVDGLLRDHGTIALALYPEFVTRLKVISHLRIDDRQNPQDGRCFAKARDEAIDIRISIVPGYFGEHIVMRLLAKEKETTLSDLGFNPDQIKHMKRVLSFKTGCILATGPTGSGKTTTLYALMSLLDRKHQSIITIEDPVEYSMSGITQIQVRERSGLSFSDGLRAILRQDPNVIMVGEIRDSDTVKVATHAALTGHLILSTLHTNDAVGVVSRLIDMGVDRYLIASTLSLVVSQRLLRKICTHCKESYELSEAEELIASNILQKDFSGHCFRGKGCEECNYSGFSGRIVAAELLVMSKQFRDALLLEGSPDELERIAKAEGMLPLAEDAFSKVLSGDTSFEEALSVSTKHL